MSQCHTSSQSCHESELITLTRAHTLTDFLWNLVFSPLMYVALHQQSKGRNVWTSICQSSSHFYFIVMAPTHTAYSFKLHTHTHTHTHGRTHMHTHTKHTQMCTHTLSCTCTRTCACTHTHIHTCTCMYACTSALIALEFNVLTHFVCSTRPTDRQLYRMSF